MAIETALSLMIMFASLVAMIIFGVIQAKKSKTATKTVVTVA